MELAVDFEEHLIRKHISSIYYTSIFITLYSFLERKLYQLCKIAETDNETKVKDLSCNGIRKYIKYIEKVLKINLDELNGLTSHFNKLGALRNRIVHNASNEAEINEDNR